MSDRIHMYVKVTCDKNLQMVQI